MSLKEETWGALIFTVVPVQMSKVCKRIGNEVQISDGV